MSTPLRLGQNSGASPRRYQNYHKFKWEHLKFWKTDHWKQITEFIRERKQLGYKIFPTNYNTIFRSLILTPFDRVKIVILGQDPYYSKGVADGLAFSILPNTHSVPIYDGPSGVFRKHWTVGEDTRKIPGSLGNIFKEYREDLGYPYPRSGDLSHWARNGILLANAVWTVEEGRPKSHYKIRDKLRWQELTAEIIDQLSIRKDKLVFILWGKVAQEWRYMIDESKHLVLVGPHPSPRNFTLTAKDGIPFLGGKYFSKACDFLGIDKRIWRLP